MRGDGRGKHTASSAFEVTKDSLPFSSTVMADRRSIVIPACAKRKVSRGALETRSKTVPQGGQGSQTLISLCQGSVSRPEKVRTAIGWPRFEWESSYRMWRLVIVSCRTKKGKMGMSEPPRGGQDVMHPPL